MTGAFLSELPAGLAITDADLLEGFRRDRSAAAEPGRPLALAQPTSTAEVSLLLRAASRHRVPVVPRGAGTGLSGGANAIDGCLILSLAKMDRILEIDAENAVAVVQPGLLNGALKLATSEQGLWYAPDPSSFEICSIGGNLATNAGGLRCMSLGITRQHVLGAEVVLASGEVMRLGGRTIKRRAGYDLLSLFIGSEGTLGVTTEATLRLRPRPVVESVALAAFPTIEGAGRAVIAITRSRLRVVALELMDDVTVAALEAWKPYGLDTTAAATLLVELESATPADLDALREICAHEGAPEVMNAETPQEQEWLMAGRRAAIVALEARGATIIDDVIVPRTRIPDLFRLTRQASARHGLAVAVFGHAGDGNFHPTIVYDRADPAALVRAMTVADELMRAAIALGGSITGEHGVGVLKKHLLAEELDPQALALMRRIKTLLDPAGILNPGKAIV